VGRQRGGKGRKGGAWRDDNERVYVKWGRRGGRGREGSKGNNGSNFFDVIESEADLLNAALVCLG
jgi:hypothetical protein